MRSYAKQLGVLFLFSALAAVAQLPTATILGVVRDTTGAVVPGATLAVRNLETGLSRTGPSTTDGSYRFVALPVGRYEIQVVHAGFRSEVRRGLTLTVGQEAVVNFTLELGAVEQTVSVTAEAPLVETTTGSLGGLVGEREVAELPLNGRNYIDLTLLQTGITQHKNMSTPAGVSGAWFSSGGAPTRSNNFLLDGAIMQNFYGASAASITDATLGIDGIREYRVITNFFSAEYGLTMGSQMTIVSKGGTNTFHGSLFEYMRNSALDARNFFDRKTDLTPRRLPVFARNQFGSSFGGPIKKDKTFFFAVYEGLRERLGRTMLDIVIPPSAKVDGGLVPQIAPVVKPFLELYPDPNLPNNQFTFPFSQPSREDYGQIRVDQSFSDRDQMFVRYTISDAEKISPRGVLPAFQDVLRSRSQYATLSESHVFSPVFLHTARFSYSRTLLFTSSPTDLIGPQFSLIQGQPMGSISIGGVSGLDPSGNSPNGKIQNVFTGSYDLFYTRGRHSLKFGTLINRIRFFTLNNSGAHGSVSFANLTQFLLGQPSRNSGVTPGSILNRHWGYTTLGFYIQDDWRVHSNLTLNLGLRYEFMTEVVEFDGVSAALRNIHQDAETTIGPYIKNPSLRNISPRFGFAWDVRGNGRTAVRGGFGLLYDLGNIGSGLSASAGALPPFSLLSTLANPPLLTTLPLVFPPEAAGKALRAVDYRLQQPHLLQYNVTVDQQLPFDMALKLSYVGSRGLNILKIVDGNPTVPQVLPDGRQFWSGNEPRVNPYWTSIELKTGAGNSWYNSLQVGLNKRLSRGLQFQSSYTWSKLIDELQGLLSVENNAVSSFGVDPTHRDVDRGLASFDVQHNWRFNTIYRLPAFYSSGGSAGALLNGWWVSGILSMQSGYPFTPALSTNRSRSKVNNGAGGIDRPDLVVGRKNDNIILGGPDLYFDPSAFTIPAAGFLGTAGRNILRGPGFANLDFSLAKDTPLGFLGESGKLEFRAEFFNILNRANFGMPGRLVYAARQNVEAPLSDVGKITGTANASRQIQLALRLVF